MKQLTIMAVIATIVLCLFSSVHGWGDGDRVLLKEIQAITLTHGQYTNGRRSPGVPQLQCMGGSAGCHSWVPSTVQCYNRGSDGYDVQWECKSEMPNQYKFGAVSVSCEGYSSPNDPYVLRGSCGLEYSLEHTSTHHSAYYGQPGVHHDSKSSYGNFFVIIAFIVIAIAIYYTCISPSGTHGDGPPPYTPNPTPGRTGGSPPPAGFRSDYFPNSGSDSGYGNDCGGSSSSYARRQSPGTGTGGGGFWTGAATGGLLGYMFGSNSRNSNTYTTNQQPYGFQDTFGSTSRTYRTSSPSSSSSSSSTHTSSGFGGTKRR